MPTYKMSDQKDVYVNKNDQAPSYCDRVLFKNNMPIKWVPEFYKSMPYVFGSDHRPVQLGLTLKDWNK